MLEIISSLLAQQIPPLLTTIPSTPPGIHLLANAGVSVAAPVVIPPEMAEPVPLVVPVSPAEPPQSAAQPSPSPVAEPSPEAVPETVNRAPTPSNAVVVPVVPAEEQGSTAEQRPRPVETEAATEAAATEASESGNASAQPDPKQVLAERLAALVERDRPMREAQLRENLIAAAIAYAQAGQFEQARQTAQHPILSPDIQTELLAQITAIAQGGSSDIAGATINLEALASICAPTGTTVVQPIISCPTAVEGKQAVVPAGSSAGFSVGPSARFAASPSAESQIAAANPQAFYSPIRPTGRLGNGDIRLMYPLITPAPITSGFGWRVHPITGDRRFHYGTDFGAPTGTPVVAAYSGRVGVAGSLGGYGLTVTLQHNNGSQETLYAHLSQIFVQPGEWVEQGSVIGRVGSTGNSTGPHLHFEFRQQTAEGWIAMDATSQLAQAGQIAWNPDFDKLPPPPNVSFGPLAQPPTPEPGTSRLASLDLYRFGGFSLSPAQFQRQRYSLSGWNGSGLMSGQFNPVKGGLGRGRSLIPLTIPEPLMALLNWRLPTLTKDLQPWMSDPDFAEVAWVALESPLPALALTQKVGNVAIAGLASTKVQPPELVGKSPSAKLPDLAEFLPTEEGLQPVESSASVPDMEIVIVKREN